MSTNAGSAERGRVCQVEVPQAARALSTLSCIDYEDAHLIEGGAAPGRTPEELARVIFDHAPSATQSTLRRGWSMLGLKLGSDGVLGWEVRRSTPDHVLVGADSRIGMPAELLLERRQDALLFCTFVRHANLIARAVWAGVEPVHRPVVRHVLEDAARRIGEMERGA